MTRTVLTALSSLLLMTGAATADNHAEPPLPIASAAMRTLDGANVGSVTFTPGTDGILIHLKVAGLEPGTKGVHLHSVGSCDPDGGFASAGGHIGEDDSAHGLLHPQGPHAGDLPNLYVGFDGKGELQTYTTRVSFDGTTDALLDADGSALMIHAQADDQFTQPGGTTGDRLACGELITP